MKQEKSVTHVPGLKCYLRPVLTQDVHIVRKMIAGEKRDTEGKHLREPGNFCYTIKKFHFSLENLLTKYTYTCNMQTNVSE